MSRNEGSGKEVLDDVRHLRPCAEPSELIVFFCRKISGISFLDIPINPKVFTGNSFHAEKTNFTRLISSYIHCKLREVANCAFFVPLDILQVESGNSLSVVCLIETFQAFQKYLCSKDNTPYLELAIHTHAYYRPIIAKNHCNEDLTLIIVTIALKVTLEATLEVEATI